MTIFIMREDISPIRFVYRNRFSRSAKIALRVARATGVKTILDYGCGKSLDVYVFRQLGFSAIGWDKFLTGRYIADSLERLEGVFDMVTCFHVLHVVEEEKIRNRILQQIKGLLNFRGIVVLSVEKDTAAERAAKKHGWTRRGDGYRTKKNHFYRGFNRDDLVFLVRTNGYEVIRTYSDPLTAILKKGG